MSENPRFTRSGISLEHRIPLLIIGLLFSVLSVTLVLAYQEVRSAALTAGRQQLQRSSAELSDLLVESAGELITEMEELAREPAVRSLLADEQRDLSGAGELLEGLRTQAALPVQVWRHNPHALAFALPSDFPQPADPAGQPLAGGYGSLFEVDGQAYQLLSVPIEQSGDTIGHLTQIRAFGSPALAELQTLFAAGATVYLVDTEGNWAGLSGDLMEGRGPVAEGALTYDRGGERYLAHATQVGETPYRMLVEENASVMLARPASFLRRGLFLFATMLGLGAGGAWVLGRRVTRPIRDLSRAAERIAAGDYSQRVPRESTDELGMLAASFNAMAEEVESAHTDLRQQVEQATTLAEELEAANLKLREMMTEAEAAQRVAEESSRVKSEFLATVSHELRTPINAIIGYTDLLSLGIPEPPGPAQVAHLGRLQRSGRHLTRLVDDILDLAKIEAGQLHTTVAVESADEAIESALSIMGPLADEKGVAVEWRRAGAIRYRGDSRRVEQILVNLLGNAVKFTPTGGQVFLSCDQFVDDESSLVRFRVRDTGVGVAPEKQELIFDRFVQGESGFRRTHEGAGLGLAISRELARRMGGDVTLESQVGKGSCFTLLMPAAETQQPEKKQPKTVELAESGAMD